ncbi:MAG: SRPBCC family protein [Myxococcota bacterium]
MDLLCAELTHAVYPHDEVYGRYCTLEEWIDCPPEEVWRYLADVRCLGEWTYSLRDLSEPDDEGTVVATDRVGGDTRIWCRAESNRAAGTVDYHCAWDQGRALWMVYLMRVVPAERVLARPGAVVLWTNCRHPFYDRNPFPEAAPPARKVWVGDLWPYFPAGHHVELQNLKHILEHRHREGMPMRPWEAR